MTNRSSWQIVPLCCGYIFRNLTQHTYVTFLARHVHYAKYKHNTMHLTK